MSDAPRAIEQILAMLVATPRQLSDLAAGLLPAQLLIFPAPGKWSTRDVLAHLRACADMLGKYIALILSVDKPTYVAVNPTTWIKQIDNHQIEFQPSLQAFTAQRTELLVVLKPLARKEWSRMAIVTGAGKPCQRTVYT